MSGARVVPHSRMRRAVIRTVTASSAIPQYSLGVTVRVGGLRDVRQSLENASVTDLLHVAVARTLPAHPLLNASYADEGVHLHPAVHLAFVVEVGDGMVTPVLRDAERTPLADLAAGRKTLTARAQAGELRPDDVVDGTFTVSNLGAFGIRRFDAMVLPPQVAVLAVGAIGGDDAMELTLTVDHRVVDGAVGARFLADLRDRLEAPEWIGQESTAVPA